MTVGPWAFVVPLLFVPCIPSRPVAAALLALAAALAYLGA